LAQYILAEETSKHACLAQQNSYWPSTFWPKKSQNMPVWLSKIVPGPAFFHRLLRRSQKAQQTLTPAIDLTKWFEWSQ
jgi:hypothetical protein